MTVGFEPTPWIGPEPKSGVLDLSTTSSYCFVQRSHWKWNMDYRLNLPRRYGEESRHHEALAKHTFKLQPRGEKKTRSFRIPIGGKALVCFQAKLITHEGESWH